MPEMHLKQPRFTYSACGPFTKSKERFQKLKKQEIQNIFTEMNQIKFAFNMIWLMETLKIQQEDSYKVLRDKAFNIAKNAKYDGYQRGLASIVYKFFDKKSTSLTDKYATGGGVNNEIKQTE